MRYILISFVLRGLWIFRCVVSCGVVGGRALGGWRVESLFGGKGGGGYVYVGMEVRREMIDGVRAGDSRFLAAVRTDVGDCPAG